MDPELTWRVVEKLELADGIAGLVLLPPPDQPAPSWDPGAHIDVTFTVGLTRQYSLHGDPTDTSFLRIAILRELVGTGGSAYAHDTLQAGDMVGVGVPRNNFELAEADSYRFVAGGIGITPLLPMIRELERRRADWTLLYGGRTRASMAFVDELAAYGEKVQIAPQDESGLLDLATYLAPPDHGTVLVYCCGPEPLLAAVEAQCVAWPPSSLRVERFAARDNVPRSGPSSFEVECAQSGITVTVTEDVSILDAVRAAGITKDSSCEKGTCGTCETEVLSGIPEHHDEVLSDEEKAENDCMMICVGRSLSDRLVLDL